MDELEEIKRKKMEQMKKEMNTSAKPSVELPDKPIIVTDATIDSAAIPVSDLHPGLLGGMVRTLPHDRADYRAARDRR